MTTLCVAHFGDVHIGAASGEVASIRRYMGKRILGTVNLRFLGRGDSFAEARERFRLLLLDVRAAQPDLIFSTGDFSAMSFPVEFRTATQIMREELGDLIKKVAVVPGNHDRYTFAETLFNTFEDYFGEWMVSDLRLPGQRTSFPIVRKLGQDYAFLFVDVVRFNPVARGRLSPRMLYEVKRYLDVLRDEGRTTCLVLHYPPVKADGQVLDYSHRCVNIERLVSLASQYRVPAMFTGHVHSNYIHRITHGNINRHIHVINAGSATYRKASTYNLYRFEPGLLRIERRSLYDNGDGPFFHTSGEENIAF